MTNGRGVFLGFVLAGFCCLPPPLAAQEGDGNPAPAATPDEAARLADEALAEGPSQTDPAQANPASPAAGPATREMGMNLLDLFFAGGIFMWPILAMSIVAVIFAVERAIGLRRRKVMPRELIEGLGQLARRQGGLDPRQAYRLCQQYPSAAASVFRAVLLKVGRPHSEVEQATTLASEREANKLYRNVRPINLAVTVSPLLGLIGTVQGMIMAFYTMSQLSAGANRVQYLAEGVYVALITTFGGLTVAIPAAVVAHFLEGRIQALLLEIDELLLNLLPQLERYEGRLRFSRTISGDALLAEESPHPNKTLEREPAPAAD